MPGHRRVKDVGYDDDDIDDYYSDEEGDYAAGGGSHEYTAEDKETFATLTPVVKAELQEAGLQASDREVEDALWNYYWDVAKSVNYLKNAKQPKSQPAKTAAKEKAKSKFDEAQERSQAKIGDCSPPRDLTMSGLDWFAGVPWVGVPEEMEGELVPSMLLPRPKLLGGSSKLAKLAEERRKKAEAAKQGPGEAEAKKATSALDRLTLSDDTRGKENQQPASQPKPRKYPARKKRDPTPPPKEPTPEPKEEQEELPDLKASPTDFGKTLSRSSINSSSSARMDLQNLLGSPATTNVSGTKAAPKSKDSASLEKKTQNLKLDSSKPAQASLPKVKSKNLDVPKLWTEGATNRKPSAAFVVIGHVDHGKSTLMGRLLLDTGAVAQRDIDKFRKQAEEIGKSSFALAWVMDTASDERERGVTVDIAQHHFSTDKADFTILDAPGHRDFIPNMIGGASMADLGVLVVDANQLESGLKGQTREHVLLARAVGLKKMVVAVNKMDGTTPAWNRDSFVSVREQVEKLLNETGFVKEDVRVVPCSGLKGENVVMPPTSGNEAWVAKESQTLVSALEEMAGSTQIPDEPISKPFRMQIIDTFRGSIQNPVSVAGQISAGSVQVGDILVIQPSGEQAVVKNIEIANEGRDYAVAGQIATLHLDGDAETLERNVHAGATISSSSKPVQVSTSLTALLTAQETLLPSVVDMHLGRLHVSARIAGLLELVDAKGEATKKKPRVVKPGQRVRVAVSTQEGVPVEAGERLVLRSNGGTVGSGTVEAVQS